MLLASQVTAQTTGDAPRIRVGDTVDVRRSATPPEFLLDASEGQTVTLSFAGRVSGRDALTIATAMTNADGDVIPSAYLLDTLTTSLHVYTLAGPGPYRFSVTVEMGSGITLAVLDGSAITVSEQPPLNVGETRAGVVPTEGELIVYPIDVRPGDVFTLWITSFDEGFQASYPAMFGNAVRDAEGRIVAPDHTEVYASEVYTATDAVPYRLDMTRYAIIPMFMDGGLEDYTIGLDTGNTAIVDGGLLSPGARVEGQVPQGKPLVYLLDAVAGQTITLRIETGSGAAFWNIYAGDNPHSLAATSFARSSAGGRSGGAFVYTLAGSPPYTLRFDGAASGLDAGYSLVMEHGDTIARQQLGVLAPGQKVQGVVPAPDQTQSYYTLDVDPEATVTLNWGVPRVEYLIVDATNAPMYSLNDDYFDGYAIVDLSTGTPPFIIDMDRVTTDGQPYTLTLALGETPLAPHEATLAGTASASTGSPSASPTGSATPASGATPPTSTCTVTASGSVNQRSGPGTTFAVSGTLSGSASADGQATGDDGMIWYRLTTGTWVRSDVVSADAGCSALPTVP